MKPRSSRNATMLSLCFVSFLLLLQNQLSFSAQLKYQTLTLRPFSQQFSPYSYYYSSSSAGDDDDDNVAVIQQQQQNTTTTLSLTLLHHIDMLSSSLKKKNTTTTTNTNSSYLFKLRLMRDANRVQSFLSLLRNNRTSPSSSAGAGFSSSVIPGLAQGSAEYFTRIGVGTPPRYLYFILDTGSDITWMQCAPCSNCYSQSEPVFDPKRSSSYATMPCYSPLCRTLDSPGCTTSRKGRKNGNCLYQVSYGDGSFTSGDFSTETLSFGRRKKVPRVAIGCGHDNEGLFVGAAGLLGLGRGELSFPGQAGKFFHSKFSYCLVDRFTSSKPSSLIFGDYPLSQRHRFTPLISNPKFDTFYYLNMTGISVGGTRVRGISAELFKLKPNGSGGVIIDSGTSVTRLTRPAYFALRNAFRAGTSGLKRARKFSLFDTCFDLSGKTEVKVPTVVLHFKKGAVMSLPATNYMIPVDSSGRYCFAFAGTTGGLSIIGNIQQQGFRVVYDLARSEVGFSPRGCA